MVGSIRSGEVGRVAEFMSLVLGEGMGMSY